MGEVGQLRTGEGQLTSGTCRLLPSRESDVVQPANFIHDQAAIAFTHTRDSDDVQSRNFTTAHRDLQTTEITFHGAAVRSHGMACLLGKYPAHRELTMR